MNSLLKSTIENELGRFYEDFFMSSRLDHLRNVLQSAIDSGYRSCSMRDFWDASEGGRNAPSGKFLILRHDIDTDPATARSIWTLERDLGMRGSFYFRLQTLDIALMREIEAAGGEASYHYEELATVAKCEKLKTKEEVLKRMPAIGRLFEQNFSYVKKLTGLPMRSVAAHGDFVNRKLGIASTEILKCNGLRRKFGIDFEAYDQNLMGFVQSRFRDCEAGPVRPSPWDRNPQDAIDNGIDIVYLLIHPRKWACNLRCNLNDILQRALQGIRYAS